MASAQRSVSGVDQGSALCSSDILQPLWTAQRSGRGSIGGGSWIGGPLDGAYEDFLGDDGIRFLTDLFRCMQARERIHFNILGTWTIGDGKVESGEEKHPSSMTRLSLLASRRYCKFLWSVRTINRCCEPSSQCLYSSRASLIARSSLLPMS